MKRRFFFFVFLLFLLVIMAGGCSSVRPVLLSSVLEINTDESGQRRIVMTAEKKTVDKLFGKDNFSFGSFIEACCPPELERSVTETADLYEVHFTLVFASLDEYQQKLAAVTGLADAVAVSRPQIGVKTGFSLAENVDLVALFSWFGDALRARTDISEKKLSSTFRAEENLLYYGGRAYPQETGKLSCHVENLLDALSIDVFTDFSLTGQWQRTIQVEFPPEMLANASNVRSYLSGLLPEGVSEKWKDNTYWRLTFTGGSLSEIDRQMRQLFPSVEGGGLTETITEESSLKLVHHLREDMNLAFFVPNEGSCRVRCFIGNVGEAKVVPCGLDGSDTSLPITLENPIYDGYICLFDRQVYQSTIFAWHMDFPCQPESLLLHTTVRSLQDITRTAAANLGDLPDLHRRILAESLSARAEGYGVLRISDTEDGFSFTFSQTGTPLTLSAGWRAFFLGREQLSFLPGPLSFGLNQGYTLSDQLDFSGFLADPANTEITCSYILPDQMSVDESFHYPETGSARFLSSGESLVLTTLEGTVNLQVPLTGANVLYPWLLLAAIFVGFATVYVLITIFVLNRKQQGGRR